MRKTFEQIFTVFLWFMWIVSSVGFLEKVIKTGTFHSYLLLKLIPIGSAPIVALGLIVLIMKYIRSDLPSHQDNDKKEIKAIYDLGWGTDEIIAAQSKKIIDIRFYGQDLRSTVINRDLSH